MSKRNIQSGNPKKTKTSKTNVQEQFDISCKLMKEELRKAKEDKEIAEVLNLSQCQLISHVSHELRAPLASISGMLKFLSSKEMSAQEQLEHLKNASNAARHLLSLVDDLLDFSKLEAGKRELVVEALDFKILIEEAVGMMLHQAKAKNVELQLDYIKTVPHKIWGDSRALTQIIINLISNAIKFTDQGQVLVRVNCLERSFEKAKLEIAVEDTGIGIPNDKLNIIFEQFQRVSSTDTKGKPGTGLGLAITEKLIEAMNGKIEVSSQLGKGSEFRCVIDFPLQSEEVLAITQEASIERLEIGGRRKLLLLDKSKTPRKILLVDDDPMILLIHNNFLNELGYTAQNAKTGTQALKMLKNKYDIVFVDMGLPDVSGYDVVKKYRETEREGEHLPIIALTASSPNDHQERFISAGVDEVILKPCTQEQMGKLIKKYCEENAEVLS